MSTFHLCTIVNRPDQYEQMLASLESAGFNKLNTRFTVFDNSLENKFDPYATINLALSQTQENYLIFCHQDLLFNQGHGYERLVFLLEGLNSLESDWSIAGNAGVNERYKYVIRISDANQSYNWKGAFPQKVFTLDENLLVFNMKNRARCSQQLSGFHLYGSDSCLHAIGLGYSCYVIDFHVTHLSGGNMSEEFYRGLYQFYDHWRNHFQLCVHKTVTGRLKVLSRHAWLERTVTFKPIRKIVLFFNRFVPLVTPYKR
ncbi:MAG: acyl esterase [Bacteroidota bacterium]|jgi:hypothetical protein|nr:acyl esterase [Cytophagales bacterium]MCE2957850.1 hypothetical protein [Flammeovirgaceae bacterium]MCZ8072179.1 hypothetical protein [Cytophagales bacterium]